MAKREFSMILRGAVASYTSPHTGSFNLHMVCRSRTLHSPLHSPGEDQNPQQQSMMILS